MLKDCAASLVGEIYMMNNFIYVDSVDPFNAVTKAYRLEEKALGGTFSAMLCSFLGTTLKKAPKKLFKSIDDVQNISNISISKKNEPGDAENFNSDTKIFIPSFVMELDSWMEQRKKKIFKENSAFKKKTRDNKKDKNK